jgi:hypothetical protein
MHCTASQSSGVKPFLASKSADTGNACVELRATLQEKPPTSSTKVWSARNRWSIEHGTQ